MSPSPTVGVAKYVTVTGVFSRMRGNVEGERSAAIHGEEGWQGGGGGVLRKRERSSEQNWQRCARPRRYAKLDSRDVGIPKKPLFLIIGRLK